MFHKYLIIIMLFSPSLLVAQAAEGVPPVSPVQAAFEAARENVRAGDAAAAVAVLQQLADNGFTAVSAITTDGVLATLEGNSDYDALVASLSVQAYPCEHDEKFSEFDFWVGEWDVQIANGTMAGYNVIETIQHGCLLVETWTSVTGGTGTSINYLDRATDEWVQIWNDASGSQINIRGNLTDDGMSLSGTIHYIGSGTTLPFRGLWTPMEDGRVRQFFEQSTDAGESWSPWFEGFYTRRTGSE